MKFSYHQNLKFVFFFFRFNFNKNNKNNNKSMFNFRIDLVQELQNHRDFLFLCHPLFDAIADLH